MRICGVDPGKSGGITVLENGIVIFTTVMPVIKSSKRKPEYDIGRIVDIFKEWKPDITYIEKALLHPKSGKSAYFGNGFSNGMIQGILSALGFPYNIVNPVIWQKAIFAGMPQKDTKQASIMYARRKEPVIDWRASEKSAVYHDGKTDSYAIAIFGMMKTTGIIPP